MFRVTPTCMKQFNITKDTICDCSRKSLPLLQTQIEEKFFKCAGVDQVKNFNLTNNDTTSSNRLVYHIIKILCMDECGKSYNIT